MGEKIELGFTGDFCPANLNTLDEQHINQLTSTIKELNRQVDFSVANFECTILPNQAVNKSKISIKERLYTALENAEFNLFCLANNHILDHGAEGLLFTKNTLEKASSLTVGAGENYEAARKPVIVSVREKKIAFINTTDASHYAAKPNKAGVYCLIGKELKRSVRAIRSSVDAIIVIIHSDLEFVSHPAPWKVKLSRKLADNGADVVIHHHPHVLQGIEKYNSSLIAYSLGNFVFPVQGNEYMEDRSGNTDESIYLRVLLDFSEGLNISFTTEPIEIENNVTIKACEDSAKRILSRLDCLSEDLLDAQLLRRNHFLQCRKHMKNFLKDIYYHLRKYGCKSAFYFIKIHLSSKMHTAWMKGFVSFGKF